MANERLHYAAERMKQSQIRALNAMRQIENMTQGFFRFNILLKDNTWIWIVYSVHCVLMLVRSAAKCIISLCSKYQKSKRKPESISHDIYSGIELALAAGQLCPQSIKPSKKKNQQEQAWTKKKKLKRFVGWLIDWIARIKCICQHFNWNGK